MEEKGESGKRMRDSSGEIGSDFAPVEEESAANESRVPVEGSNPRFEKYYRLQQICTDEEFQDFIASLSSPLPSSLRVNMSHPLRLLLEFVFNLQSERLLEEDPGRALIMEKRLNQSCKSYLVSQYSRKTLKRESLLADLHSLIVYQDEFGTISSQELVSMLPCVALDVRPGHFVLDMCSAPGSKSTQMLDEVLSSRNKHLGIDLQKGVFICNDASSKRLDTLSSRISRIPSPNVLITCIDASFFPTFRSNLKGELPMFRFDRVLVDSPCSGDGTLRKNPDIWQTWKPEKALSLYKKQTSLLSRAFKLLKPGGRLVYSTCSLNPIENEAVVSTFLCQFPEAKLVEPPNMSEGQLHISRGLPTWKVYCDLKNQDELQLFDTLESVPEVPFKEKLAGSMFPSKEWLETGSFRKCFRVFPHRNNTGGFFFAVIEKEGGVGRESHSEKQPRSSPLKYEQVELEDFKLISEFYGFRSETGEASSAGDLKHFPPEIRNHLEGVSFLDKSSLVRRKSHNKTIYLIGEDVSWLIRNYSLEVDLKSVGTRAFEYLKGRISGDGRCRWRISQMSSNYLVRFMTRRLIFVSVSLLDLLDQDGATLLGREEVLDLEKRGELLGLRELCSETSVETRLESGGVLVVLTPPRILKYGGDSRVNPSFQELHQGIPISGILYEDSGISLFVSRTEIKSIKQLILI